MCLIPIDFNIQIHSIVDKGNFAGSYQLNKKERLTPLFITKVKHTNKNEKTTTINHSIFSFCMFER